MRKFAATHHSPPTRPPLSDEAIELIVARLQVIAEATRIQLLQLLNAGDATVQALTDCVPTTRQTVSHHLSVLHQAGMVSRRKDGRLVYYSLVDWTGWWLVEQIGLSVTSRLDELQDAFGPTGSGELGSAGQQPNAGA